MATQMFSAQSNHFKYIITYKFSQDHIELLFSCIRSRGGWNNNPNFLQFKYALRKMLMKNAITTSKNSNCLDFSRCNNIVPLFHTTKHKTPSGDEVKTARDESEMLLMGDHLDNEGHSEFMSNACCFTLRDTSFQNCLKNLLVLGAK